MKHQVIVIDCEQSQFHDVFMDVLKMMQEKYNNKPSFVANLNDEKSDLVGLIAGTKQQFDNLKNNI